MKLRREKVENWREMPDEPVYTRDTTKDEVLEFMRGENSICMRQLPSRYTIPSDIISLLLKPEDGSRANMALQLEVEYIIGTGQGIKRKARAALSSGDHYNDVDVPELTVGDSVFINDAIHIVGRDVTGTHRLHAPGYKISGITWERDPTHVQGIRETSVFEGVREGLGDVVYPVAV